MTAMTPGSNLPLTAARVAVDVTAPVRLDVSGLLLAADGKVRSDDDFVFYNQPSGPGVTHSAAPGGGDTITVNFTVVAQLHIGARQGSTNTSLTQSPW